MNNSTRVALADTDRSVDAAQYAAPALTKGPTWAQAEGSPRPLGVTLIEVRAESVMLLLYSCTELANPLLTFRFVFLRNKSGRIWHCRIPITELGEARYYAYSVSGQPIPQLHSFDPQKVLLDPYAKCIFFPPRFDRQLAMREGSNAGRAPLGALTVGRCLTPT